MTNSILVNWNYLSYLVLVVLLSLNRETGVVVVALYIAMQKTLNRGILARFAVLLAVYVSVQIGLHLALGSAPHVLGLIGTFQYNLATWQDAAYESLILLPLLIMIVRGYPTAPTLHKRLLWVAALYGGAILIGSSWNEVQRLILPLAPLLLPFMFETRL